MTFQSLGSLSATSFGGVSLEAASASSPYVAFLPLQVTTPLAALQSAALTPHFCAAASIVICLAFMKKISFTFMTLSSYSDSKMKVLESPQGGARWARVRDVGWQWRWPRGN